MPLRSAIARFCLQMEADGKSPLTIRVYRGELERLAAYLGPGRPVDRIRPDPLARYHAGRDAAGRYRSPSRRLLAHHTCGKHARIQEVRYPKSVAKMLRRHLREQDDDTGGAVFTSSRGGRLSASPARSDR